MKKLCCLLVGLMLLTGCNETVEQETQAESVLKKDYEEVTFSMFNYDDISSTDTESTDKIEGYIFINGYLNELSYDKSVCYLYNTENIESENAKSITIKLEDASINDIINEGIYVTIYGKVYYNTYYDVFNKKNNWYIKADSVIPLVDYTDKLKEYVSFKDSFEYDALNQVINSLGSVLTTLISDTGSTEDLSITQCDFKLLLNDLEDDYPLLNEEIANSIDSLSEVYNNVNKIISANDNDEQIASIENEETASDEQIDSIGNEETSNNESSDVEDCYNSFIECYTEIVTKLESFSILD